MGSFWSGTAADREEAEAPDAILALVSRHGASLKFLTPHLRSKKNLVGAAVRSNGLALRFAPLALRCDRRTVLEAVQQNGLALRLASLKLRDDKGVVLVAVAQNGMAMQYASQALRCDKDVVLLALQTSGQVAMRFASNTSFTYGCGSDRIEDKERRSNRDRARGDRARSFGSASRLGEPCE